MDQEKSSAEITNIFPKAPGLFVIKGRQSEYMSSPMPPLYAKLKKFARIKDGATFQIQLPLESLSKRIIKRSGDIFLSVLVIVGLLSWIIPLIALLIKLDSKGPIFFLQKRNKRGDKTFTCIKFRSLIENEDADLLQATVNDERITRFGRFLRNHYLDELPQFFNVFIGDMSVVGPRPYMVDDNNKYEELIEYYDYRHKVKPGITGLSQAMGYVGEARIIQAMRERVQLDIFYVRHWSLRLDLKILRHALRKIAGA
jgi:putative colanic acid biosysnthesis UDP-glucose lipid carrier transferase